MTSMTDEVWISGFKGSGQQFDRPGLRHKLFGHEWSDAEFIQPLLPAETHKAALQADAGYALPRSRFPEAAAVWNEDAWSRTGDLFAVAGFYAVKNSVAEVLKNFELVKGSLVPFPILADDLKTPIAGEYYFLNIGDRKKAFRPKSSTKVHERWPNSDSWRAGADSEIAVAKDAVGGADIWIDERLYGQVFMSGRLVQSLKSANPKADLALKRCKVLAGP